jgi:hypothetical protein
MSRMYLFYDIKCWHDSDFGAVFENCVENSPGERERKRIIWNFDNVQKAYATRGYEAKKQVS